LHTNASQSFYSYGVGDTATWGGHWEQSEEWAAKHVAFKQGPDGAMYEKSKQDPEYDEGHGFQWRLPAPCALASFSGQLWCETLHAIFQKQEAALKAREIAVHLPGSSSPQAPRRPRIVFVGGQTYFTVDHFFLHFFLLRYTPPFRVL
jgi:hypothetical protein